MGKTRRKPAVWLGKVNNLLSKNAVRMWEMFLKC